MGHNLKENNAWCRKKKSFSFFKTLAQFILGVMQRKKIFLRGLLRKRPAHSLGVLGFLPMGDYGMLCLEPGFLTRNQREAIRKVLARKLKPVGGRY